MQTAGFVLDQIPENADMPKKVFTEKEQEEEDNMRALMTPEMYLLEDFNTKIMGRGLQYLMDIGLLH